MEVQAAVRTVNPFRSLGSSFAILAVLLALNACAAGGSGPNTDETTIFVNPGDSTIASNKGVTVFGNRDAAGKFTAITEVALPSDDGNAKHNVRVSFDAQVRIERAALAGGGSARFEYVSATQFVATVTSADGRESSRVPIDLTTASAQNLAPNSIKSSSIKASSIKANASGSTLSGMVESRCGLTPLDADLSGSYTSNTTPTPVAISFKPINVGSWQYSLPQFPVAANDLDAISKVQLEKLRQQVTLACDSAFSQIIAGAVLCSKLKSIGAPAAVQLTCSLLKNDFGKLCPALKALVNGPLKPKDNYAFQYQVKITATLTGTNYAPGEFEFTVFATDTGIPTKTHNATDVEAGTGEFTVKPPNPTANQGYAFTVKPICATENTMVRISVAGSDNYNSSWDFTITAASPTATASVPGAQTSGIRDLVTVKILPNGSTSSTEVWFR